MMEGDTEFLLCGVIELFIGRQTYVFAQVNKKALHNNSKNVLRRLRRVLVREMRLSNLPFCGKKLLTFPKQLPSFGLWGLESGFIYCYYREE